ncbi:MAG: four helix bundle protein [Chitinophagales bacterium]|nr:four helix bundle protein [Chitinophagales bacterium]
MFLDLTHTKTGLYKATRSFVLQCYKASRLLPPEEKYILTQQIRRAALSVHLNFSEGASKKSAAERKRFYEISRSSLIEIDAALDVAFDLEYIKKEQLDILGEAMNQCFRQLSAIINSFK